MVVLRRYVKQTKNDSLCSKHVCFWENLSTTAGYTNRDDFWNKTKSKNYLKQWDFRICWFFFGGGLCFFFRGFLHSRLMRCKHFLAFVSPSPKTSRRDDYRPAFSIKSGWRCGNLAFFLSKSGSKKRSGFVCVCNPSSILCLKTRRIRLALFLPSHSLLRLSPVFCSKAVESFSHLQWVGRTYCHRAGFARLLIWDLRESGALSSRESTRSQCLQCGFWYSHPLPPHPTPHPTRFPKKFTPSFVQYF